jgi:hypothetical protein
MITSKKMAEVISEDISVEDKVNTLIDEALKAGGRDNVTVVLVEVCSDEEEKEEDVVPVVIETTEMERPEPRKKNLIPLLLLLVLLVAVCIWILSSPGSDKNGAEKISADTTLVESADTVFTNDSSLISPVDSVDTDIQ